MMPWMRYDYTTSLGPGIAGFVLSCSTSGRSRSAMREAAAGLRRAALVAGAATAAKGGGCDAAQGKGDAATTTTGTLGVIKMGCRGLSLLVWRPPAVVLGGSAAAAVPLLHAASRTAAALAVASAAGTQPRLAYCERIVGFDTAVPAGDEAGLEAAVMEMVRRGWEDGWVRGGGGGGSGGGGGGGGGGGAASDAPPPPTTYAVIYRRHATAGPAAAGGSSGPATSSSPHHRPPLDRGAAIGAAARGMAAGLAAAGAPGPHTVCLTGGSAAGPVLALALEVLPARPPGGGPPAFLAGLGLVPRAALDPGARDVRVRRLGGREGQTQAQAQAAAGREGGGGGG
jgi:hypothetical protein